MNESDITPFIEPVFHFCLKRLNSRYDAEDLASEIMVHVLNGLNKYKIESIEGWVWRIAHNRYARFIQAREKRRNNETSVDDESLLNVQDDYDIIDAIEVEDSFPDVFRYLHTLSRDYRDITVDYYIGEMCIRDLAKRYSLPETTIKWRLNVSREKLKKRIGENKMAKVYKRLNWSTDSNNGDMDPDKYLHSQLARAICEAAYEKPVTVEEISLKTGLPTIFIEDELPKLIYGDAIVDHGNGKYSTDLIILRMCDKIQMEKKFAPIVSEIGDYYEKLFADNADQVKSIGFIGCDRGMSKLGYIALPSSVSNKIGKAKNNLKLENGPYPPRKDGGYGWFLVEETEDETEIASLYSRTCNIAKGEEGDIYYNSFIKYFSNDVYHGIGTQTIIAKNIMKKSIDGNVPDGVFNEDELAGLIKSNLICKSDSGYKFTFPCFTDEQLNEFNNLFNGDNEVIDQLLINLILDINTSFRQFVPKRLDSQINQWASVYSQQIVGYIAESLINRGVLEQPDDEIPMTNGVLYVAKSLNEV